VTPVQNCRDFLLVVVSLTRFPPNMANRGRLQSQTIRHAQDSPISAAPRPWEAWPSMSRLCVLSPRHCWDSMSSSSQSGAVWLSPLPLDDEIEVPAVLGVIPVSQFLSLSPPPPPAVTRSIHTNIPHTVKAMGGGLGVAGRSPLVDCGCPCNLHGGKG